MLLRVVALISADSFYRSEVNKSSTRSLQQIMSKIISVERVTLRQYYVGSLYIQGGLIIDGTGKRKETQQDYARWGCVQRGE